MSLDFATVGVWLARSALGGTLLLLLGLTLMRWIKQPARRQRVGEFSLLAALAVAAASLAPAWVVLPWLPPQDRVEQPALPLPEREAFFQVALPQGLRNNDVVNVESLPDNPPWHDRAAEAPGLEENRAELRAADMLEGALPWLVALYLAGAGLFLLRWLLGHWVLWRILRHGVAAPAQVQQLFEECLALVRVQRRPRLLVSPRLRVPISFGVLRPTIVLPERLARSEQTYRLGWVFAHELTHLERRDALSAVLLALGQSLFFVLPWFWWMRRQVRLCQEYVADAAAAALGHADEYAEFLLSWTAAPKVPAGAAAVSGNTSDLYRRITMVLSNRLPVERRCPRLWMFVVGAALLGLATFLGGVTLWADEPRVIIIVAPQPPKSAAPAVRVVPFEAEKFRIEPIRVEVIDPKRKNVLLFRDGAAPRMHVEPFRLETVDPDKKDVLFLRAVPAPRPEAKPAPAKRLLVKPEGGGVIELEIQGGPDLPPDVLKKFRGAAPGAFFELKIEDGKVLGADVMKALPPDLARKLEALHGAIELRLDDGNLPPDLLKALPPDVLKLLQSKGVTIDLTPGDPAVPGVRGVPGAPGEKARIVKWKIDAAAGGVPVRQTADQIRELIERANKEMLDRATIEKELLKILGKTPAPLPVIHGFVADDLIDVVTAPGLATRLGLKLTRPAEILAEHLNLKKGQGLIVSEVKAGSAAARAGFKVNDVVLRLNDKAVADDPAQFGKGLDKPGEMTVVVLRKGKEETIRGVGAPAGEFKARIVTPAWPVTPAVGPGNVMTTTFRTGNRFNTRHQEGSLIITVTGKLSGDKAQVEQIVVQDGAVVNNYETVEAVPAAHRDKVRHLVSISGGLRVESK